jgi:hypothetical protein
LAVAKPLLVLKRRRHHVETPRELAEFVSSTRADTMVEAALPKGFRGPLERGDPLMERAVEP